MSALFIDDFCVVFRYGIGLVYILVMHIVFQCIFPLFCDVVVGAFDRGVYACMHEGKMCIVHASLGAREPYEYSIWEVWHILKIERKGYNLKIFSFEWKI